jgi:hypothetical protein
MGVSEKLLVILMVEFHWVEKLELPYGVGHK